MSRLAVFALALSFTGFAHANPVSTESLHVRQTPHTHHVQLTYVRYDSTFDLKSVTRDGQAVAAGWVPASFRANLGSGVSTNAARQICDCLVPVGAHSWRVTNGGNTLQADLTVVADEPDPTPADAGNPDAMPWEQPDPVEMQGLDCAAVCPAFGPDASAPRPADGSIATVADGSTRVSYDGQVSSLDGGATAPKSDSGCSQGLSPVSLGTLGFALVALAALGARRRRG